MSIFDYQQAFGAADKTTAAMKKAIAKWQELYYHSDVTKQVDPCQRIGYTVVNKLVRTIFGEYSATAEDAKAQLVISRLDAVRKDLMQMALVEGECYIKPCIGQEGFSFLGIPRSNVLVFARNAFGEPVDVGTAEKSIRGKYYYTLLERRTVDEKGYLTITNRLFRSNTRQNLGTQVSLTEHPDYTYLPNQHTYELPLGGIGLVRMKTPILNCVDGSADGVSIYGAAVGLIENINANEAQMNGEFQRGQSRIIASADMLRKDSAGVQNLEEDLFVGLDEDPGNVGITIFSPEIRQQVYLARKQEYLRNVESIIGLQRGMLSDANTEDRTATEINSSAGEFNLTVIDLQGMWKDALEKTVELCKVLAKLFGMPVIQDTYVSVDWGNGVLYDEDKKWAEYVQMVDKGLIKPEIALGWRFNQPARTTQEQQLIRRQWMPEENTV